jgi:hypothetical protein
MLTRIFQPFYALAVDDSSSRTGFPLGLFTTLPIKREVNTRRPNRRSFHPDRSKQAGTSAQQPRL